MIWIAAVENTAAKEVSVTNCKPFCKVDELLPVFYSFSCESNQHLPDLPGLVPYTAH